MDDFRGVETLWRPEYGRYMIEGMHYIVIHIFHAEIDYVYFRYPWKALLWPSKHLRSGSQHEEEVIKATPVYLLL